MKIIQVYYIVYSFEEKKNTIINRNSIHWCAKKFDVSNTKNSFVRVSF